MRPYCEAHRLPCAVQAGRCTLRQILEAKRLARVDAPHDFAAEDEVPALGPKFDKGRRVLTVHGTFVRQFRRNAENQIRILESFQDQRWPPWIENPFGRPGPTDPRHRLSDAVADLNNDQELKLIHFWVEKGTQRVSWELTEEASDEHVAPAYGQDE